MTPAAIIDAVADRTGISPRLMRSRSMEHKILAARDAAMYEMWTLLGHYTLTRIGAEFGRRHATVILALKREAKRRGHAPHVHPAGDSARRTPQNRY